MLGFCFKVTSFKIFEDLKRAFSRVWFKMPFWMLNPYWQMSGVWAGTIYGNSTQQSEAWHRPIFEKLIQIRAFRRKIILNELRGVTQIWMNFPENGLAHTHSTNTEVLMKFLWMSFPEIVLAQFALIFYKNWIGTHKKMMAEFSRNPSVSHPGKMKFRKNFWMSFPGFANKG